MTTDNQRLVQSKQCRVLSEKNINIIKGHLKNSGLSISKKQVLSHISCNLQVDHNNKSGKVVTMKSATRLISKLNSTAYIASKTNSSLNTSKPPSQTAVLKVHSVLNENVSNILNPFICKPTTVGFPNQLNAGIFVSRNLLSVTESAAIIHNKEQKWKIACIVDDVDKNDEFDTFHVGAYCKPIFEYMMTLENKHTIKQYYLANHKYIRPSNRNVVVNWLVEIQQEFHVTQETLYLAVGIFDRYLQENMNVTRDKLQLIGATSLLLSCKYEQIYVPTISDFVYLSANSFTRNEVKLSLVDVFKSIGYSLSIPLSLTFLRRFSKVSGIQLLQYSLAKYFLELAMIDCNLAHIVQSKIAASGLLLAIVITNSQLEDKPGKCIKLLLSLYWTDVMQKHTTYKIDDLVSTVRALADLVLRAPECKYKAVYKKYMTSKLERNITSYLLNSPVIKFMANAY